MATREIKTKIVLDGEAEYRKGLEASYKALSNLGKEVTLASARYADSADAMEKYSAKAEALKSAIEGQKKLISSLAERLRYADQAYEGNTEAQELYAKKIKTAQNAMARMEKELRKTEDAMDDMTDGTQDAGRAMDSAADKTEDMGDAAEKATSGVEKLSNGFTVMKGVLSNLVTDALRKGASALKGFISDSLTVASDMEEVDNVVSTAFKNQTKAVTDFANKASTQYGLSALEAQNYAGKLGAALNALGLKDQALEMSTTLTGLAGDLASFWNMSADESYSKIFAGVISGETEGLKSLGIVMTETNLQAYALSEGIKKKYSAMTADEKAMLRYKYVLSMTAEAQGDFAKTSGSYANQTKIAQLNLNNLKNTMGKGLLPSITSIIGKFNEWAGGDYANTIFDAMGQKIGELVDGAFEKLLEALDWCAQNTDKIKTALVSLGSGIVAGKIVKLVSSFASMVTAIKTAGTATALLSSGLGGLPFTAAIAGAAALVGAIVTISQNADTMANKLKNLKFDVDGESTQAITDGINAGIEAADKLHEIRVSINADTESLKTQLDDIFDEDSAGGETMTYKEYKAATKYVTEIVKPDIEAAQTSLDEYKKSLAESLTSLTDVDGEQIYTKSEAKALAETATSKTQSLINNLDAAYTQYKELLLAIRKKGGEATEADIAELDALAEKIGEIRISLAAMHDEALQKAEAVAKLVESGGGGEFERGETLGYYQQNYDYKIEEAAEQKDAELLKISEMRQANEEAHAAQMELLELMDKNSTEYHGAYSAEMKRYEDTETALLADTQAAIDAETMATEKAAAEYTEDFERALQGIATAEPAAAAAIAALAKYRDYYAELMALYETDDFTIDQAGSWVEANKDGLMQLGAIDEATLAELEENIKSENGAAVTSLMMSLADALADGADNAALELEDNPFMNTLQQWLNMEGADFSALDWSNLEGILGDAIKALDWLTVGDDVIDGMLLGINTSTTDMSAEDVAAVRDKLIAALRAALDSHSPAQCMVPIGEDIVAGILQPIKTGDTGENGSMADALDSFKQILLDSLGSIGSEMLTVGESAGSNLSLGILSKSGAAQSAGRSVAQSAARGAKGQTSQFYSVGSAMISGMVEGIYDGESRVVSAIISTVNAAVNAARDELEINSPSRVFRWIGQMSAEGYALGLEDQLRSLEGTIQSSMRSVAQVPQTDAAAYAANGAPVTGTAQGGIVIYQTVNANETDYAAQQREAARSFANIARRL